MKICYLVSAHNTPNHLWRLADALAGPEEPMYVHIDSKSDLSKFLRAGSGNVVFLDDRIPVTWGGFSQVQAALNLIKTALASAGACDYYCFISGSDYPIRSKDYIHGYLMRNRGKEFMNLVEMSDAAADKPISRLTTYHIEDEVIRRYVRSRYLAIRLAKVLDRLAIQRGYKGRLGELKPYAGSQWWILSKPAVQYVVDFVSRRPDVVAFFRNTVIPDESFFQTIIGNSPFRENTVGNVTFTDWSREEGPYPAMIDDAYVRFFEACGSTVDDRYGKREALFARKFPDDSARLVEFIQKHVW